jgi:hypothetical protein
MIKPQISASLRQTEKCSDTNDFNDEAEKK